MISILVTLVIIGLLLWLVNNYIPMDGKIKSILNVIIIIAVVVWLLQAFGLIGGIGLR
jgi:undecaprenyl pyrophosphate phosphatase UppP